MFNQRTEGFQQQTATGLFQQSPQENTFFQSQQPTPQQGAFGFGSGGYSSFGSTQTLQSSQSIGCTSDKLKWIPASNGSIPPDAVQCGWSKSTHKPLYVARAKRLSTVHVCPGFITEGETECRIISPPAAGSRNSRLVEDTAANYEVLVNPGNIENISWFYYNNCGQNSLPRNLLKVCSDLSGSAQSIFVGRTFSPVDNHIVSGPIINGRLHYSVPSLFHKNVLSSPLEPFGYEILCIIDKSSRSYPDKMYLYDVEYDMDGSNVKWTHVSLDRGELSNNSSVEQKLRVQCNVLCPTTFKWDVTGCPGDKQV